MKQPKKLTRQQKAIVAQNKLVPKNWMLLDEDNISLLIINKATGNKRHLWK